MISRAEFVELYAKLDRQATRGVVSRGFELPPIVIAGSILRVALADDLAKERKPENARNWATARDTALAIVATSG